MGKHLAPVKRLAPVMAILAMLIPAAGYALGLGNIAMNSALNQPLNAEIELLSLQRGDLNNLVVKLGSTEDFQRVGADRAFFLTKINFEIIKRKNGTAYVQLTTVQTVTEPFLDFVVEARWPRGRILREFTVLVDPPVLSDEAPAPIQQSAAMQQMAPASRAAPARQAPIRSRASLAPVTRQAGEITYGPVRYNDTLWEIANEMRPSGVTVNQMMAALVRENPNAFYNGNVNQLKAGYVLRVSDSAALTDMTVASANAEIERQRVEWQARKSGRLVRQVDAPAGGRIARDGMPGEAASRFTDQARLKLVAPGSQGAGSGAGDEGIDQLRQDLLLAAEALDANRQETDDLKSRLSEMEEQLEAMQRLIMLKDDEMLAMQNNLSAEDAPEEMMSESMSKTSSEEMGESMDEAGEDMMAKDGVVSDDVLEKAIDEDMAAIAMEEEAAKAAPVPALTMEEPGILDDPLVMYGGIGILVLIIAVVIQRRRKMQDGFEESILNVGEGGDAGATAETMAQGGESSMVSDFAMSEMSGMSGIEGDAADVDPISEADVYLAYGRHQQAEDILKEALLKEPERHELKLKLLEVSFAAKDREAFEQGAQEFHDALGDESDPMWAKVATMGSQLCPGSDLFGGGSAEALKEDLEETAVVGDDDLLDFDFDLDTDLDADTISAAGSGDPDTDEVFAELEAATSDIAGLDFKKVEDNTSLDLDMDLDMGSDPLATEAPALASESTTDDKPADDNSLDFDVSSLDFDLDASIDAISGVKTEAAADNDSGLDFDIEGLGDFSTEPAVEPASEPDTESSPELALDDTLELDVGLETELTLDTDTPVVEVSDVEALETATAETGDADELEDVLGDDLDDVFGEVDEVGTKLDLAKAYVDMGDGDGARSILDEVLEEGDDDQKKQAEELISQLA
ncbi:MAG: FimV family protein [Ectothiorhodospiraceae bacterium]|nr:FimV family protein [Ectothiorhodospiraceae bacterium]